MRRNLLLVGTLLALAFSGPSLNASTIRASSHYGQGAFSGSWDLTSGTLSASGLTGFTMTDCPNQDVSGGACSSDAYDFLFQINSAPANAVLNFSNILDSSFTYGLVYCDSENLVLLCSNTTQTTLSGLSFTATQGSSTLSLAFSGAFPSYPVSTGGQGGLTIFIEECLDNPCTDTPPQPTLALGGSSTAAPEPASIALLGFGLAAIGVKLRRKAA